MIFSFHLLLQFYEFYQIRTQRIPSIPEHFWARSFLLISSNWHLILHLLSECLKQWCNYVGNYWCKLSNTANSLSFVFWLTSSVASKTTTLLSKVYTLFSSEDILSWITSTSFFNCEILLLDFVLISFFGDSGSLTTDFSFFLPILRYI